MSFSMYFSVTLFAKSDQFIQEVRLATYYRHTLVVVVCRVMDLQRIVPAADLTAVAVA